MSYLKDREIWLSNVPTDNPPAGYVWVFIQNGVFVVRDSNGLDKIMATTTGTVTNATSASYVEYSNVASKPALISGSSQVSYTGLSNIPVGIVSGSAQVTYSGLTGIPSGIVSGSAQVASFGIFATTGSNGFNGSQSITGSLTVTGQVVAQTLNVQQVTSSIVYSSGSNVFGNTLGNTQQFTGSMSVTGSVTVAGAGIFTGALNGTSASFTGVVSTLSSTTNGFLAQTNANSVHPYFRWVANNRSYWAAAIDSGTDATFKIGGGNTIGSSPFFTIDSLTNASTFTTTLAVTGAATFSSSVTATNFVATSADTTGTNVNIINTSTGGYNWNIFSGGSSGTLAPVGSLIFRDSTIGASRMVISSAGNVGIGTDSPARLLEVSVADRPQMRVQYKGISNLYLDISDERLARRIPSDTGGNNFTISVEGGQNSGGFGAFTIETGTIGNLTERMRVTQGGDVLIGCTSVPGAGSATNGASLGNTGFITAQRAAATVGYFGRSNAGELFAFYNNTTQVGNISIGASTTSYNTTSDYRLKEDLKEINGLEKISALKVYDFKFKNSENRMDGVLAHELAEVLPYAVHGEKDGEEMQGVDYSKIVPVLVKSIQEQQTLIESLKSRIEILEQ